MSQNLIIEETLTSEIEELLVFAKNCFVEFFAEDNSPEDMNKYLEESFTFDKLMSEFDCPQSKFFHVRANEKIVAYLKVNWRCEPNESNSSALEIERLYVDSTFHGKGLAQMLVAHALSLANNLSKQKVWLGVWEHNPRAIRFYEKCGFRKTGEQTFKLGKSIQIDHVMAIEF